MKRELGEVVADGFDEIAARLARIEDKLDAILDALGARTAEALPTRLLARREARGDAQ